MSNGGAWKGSGLAVKKALQKVEGVETTEVNYDKKEAVVKVGFVFLMVAMVFAIYNDISRMLPG